MRAPRSTAERRAATASRMSPSSNGSCPGSAPARNRRAAATSPRPRRTSTEAVVSETPRPSASARTSSYAQGASCQVGSAIGVVTVRTASDGALAQNPWTWLNSAPVLRTIAALLCSAGLACAAAPASAPTRTIALGVTVSGNHVGGLTAEPARARIARSFLRPLRIVAADGTTTVEPSRAGARAAVDAAVAASLEARPGATVNLAVRYSGKRLASIVDTLAKRYDRAPVDASVTGADGAGPTFSAARAGLAVDRRTKAAAIGQLLRDSTRAPLHLVTRVVPPRRTAESFGPVIVITRAANTLRLYDGPSLV